MTDAAPARPARRRRIVVWSVVGGLLLALVAAGAWVGVRALQAQSELRALVPLADELQAAASDRDLDALQSVADRVASHSARAAELTGDPVWRAAEIIPFAGNNLRAVRVVSTQLDAISSQGVQPLLGVVRDAGDGALIVDGAIDLELLASAQAPLASAAGVFAAAGIELTQIDRSGLLAELDEAVDRLQTVVLGGAEAVGAASDATLLLPAMLGSDGPRTILLMFQNNAEPRTGGGLTGTFAQFDAVGGAISLVGQGDSGDFPASAEEILPVPETDVQLYGPDVARFVQNATSPTDFELSAQLAAAWWQRATGVTADTVISVDPLVIRALVEASGPLTLPDGTQLTADDFVQRILVDPYMTLDQEEQTTFLQGVTAAAFAQLLSGGAPPLALMTALAEPIRDGRVAIWSAHESENALVRDTAVGGPLARHRIAQPDTFAVYFNDGGGSKLSSFLEVDIQPGTASCREDERDEAVLAVTLTNTAPADAATFPPSMTGAGTGIAPPGYLTMNVSVAAPPGYTSLGATTPDERLLTVDVDDRGFPTSLAQVQLAPGASLEVTFRFVAPEAGEFEPAVITTPLINAPAIQPATAAACR